MAVRMRISKEQLEARLRDLEARELTVNRERYRRGLYDNPFMRWLTSIEWTRPRPSLYSRGSVKFKGTTALVGVTAVAGEFELRNLNSEGKS